MAASHPLLIFLTGFSGTGKSQVARLAAQKLNQALRLRSGQGWRAADTDAIVEGMAGQTIAAIFAQEGEAAFRELEAEALRRASCLEKAVVATGGGSVLREDNRRLMAQGFVVCLEARPETVLARLRENDGSERPLLSGPDPLARIRSLKAQRQPLYALADYTVHTDGLTPEEVASEVVRAWRLAPRRAFDPDRLSAPSHEPFPGAACLVRTAGRSYPVFVGWGALAQLGEYMKEAGLDARAHLISDEVVFALHGAAALAAVRAAGFEAEAFVIPAGEESKSLKVAARVYDWLAERRAERGESVVALGGGVVGDLAGFVAATYLRGLPLVQAPTSLLAMVDAAVGGKTAVNLPQAKNLVGAFHQPHLVVADVSTLTTLPSRELTAGWAEVIKHALIQAPALLGFLEEKADAVAALEPEPATEAIARSIAIKARIVEQDEREETGLRSFLNYGHTIGHALEAAADYRGLLHGEAVAVGMVGAARIGQRLGLLPEESVAKHEALLDRFGLPRRAPGIDAERALAAMALDKKVRRRAIRWVLLEAIGRPVLRDDVPEGLVLEVVGELVAG